MNRYTNVMLTIIAACLLLLTVQSLEGTARAQDGYVDVNNFPDYRCSGKLKKNYLGDTPMVGMGSDSAEISYDVLPPIQELVLPADPTRAEIAAFIDEAIRRLQK